MASPFGILLASLLTQRNATQRAFARAVKCAQPTVASVISGRRKPPVRQLERWADHFALEGDDRYAFLIFGNAEHATPWLGDYVRDHLGRLVSVTAAKKALRR